MGATPPAALRAAEDFFTRHGLSGTSGIVAISGGPDSVCLARILCELHGQGLVARIVLAHLNHQLRGPAADEDEAFVVALASEWNLPCRTQSLDVALAAEQAGANLEDTARRLRYEWFAQTARAEGASWVATGHTAEDQAETVLFRLLRGSGLQGLAGMRQRRALAAGIDVIRPLLDVRRAQIIAHLEMRCQSYCRDETNADPRFTRNRIRHELMPLLAENYNVAVTEMLCRLAEQTRAAENEILLIAARLVAEAELPRAGTLVILDAMVMQTASRHLRREMFRLVWQREHWPMGHMDYDAWNRLALLVEQDAGALDLPDGIHVRRKAGVVQLQNVRGTGFPARP